MTKPELGKEFPRHVKTAAVRVPLPAPPRHCQSHAQGLCKAKNCLQGNLSLFHAGFTQCDCLSMELSREAQAPYNHCRNPAEVLSAAGRYLLDEVPQGKQTSVNRGIVYRRPVRNEVCGERQGEDKHLHGSFPSFTWATSLDCSSTLFLQLPTFPWSFPGSSC